MYFLAATAADTASRGTAFANWPVIKQIAVLLGYVMRGIFLALDAVGIQNIALCVVLFTFITRIIIFPLTWKQQKFSKLNSVMAPEIQAIQAKYKNKKDNASMQKMQVEQQMVYEKYGVSMSAGCLPSLLSIVILFALYPVVYNLEKYVPELANYSPEALDKMYSILGIIDGRETPKLGVNPTVLIPILAAAFQFLATQLMMKTQPQPTGNGGSTENALASSMKTMNYTMPIMSLVFCFSFPSLIGVYWIIMSVVMVIQQLVINKMMESIKVEDLIKQNLEKQNKKRAKKGLPPLNANANMNTKGIDREKEIERRLAANKARFNIEERDAQVKESTEYYNSKSKAKPGSLAAKANMVKDYNEKHNK